MFLLLLTFLKRTWGASSWLVFYFQLVLTSSLPFFLLAGMLPFWSFIILFYGSIFLFLGLCFSGLSDSALQHSSFLCGVFLFIFKYYSYILWSITWMILFYGYCSAGFGDVLAMEKAPDVTFSSSKDIVVIKTTIHESSTDPCPVPATADDILSDGFSVHSFDDRGTVSNVTTDKGDRVYSNPDEAAKHLPIEMQEARAKNKMKEEGISESTPSNATEDLAPVSSTPAASPEAVPPTTSSVKKKGCCKTS